MALLCMLPAAGGCGLFGGIPDQASCDGRPTEKHCVDLLTNRNNQFETTLKALCVGTFSTSLCNHTGALGGCKCEGCENGVSIDWFLPDAAGGFNTADDVRKKCPQSFVAP